MIENTIPTSNFVKRVSEKTLFLLNLQIGALVHRREEPSPSCLGRRRCLGHPWSHLLDVRSKGISGNLTSVAWGDIWVATSWGRLFLVVVVINNSNKPTTLGCSAGQCWVFLMSLLKIDLVF